MHGFSTGCINNSIRHRVACSSNPGVGGIFFLSLAIFCFTLLLAKLSNHYKSLQFLLGYDNPKAAAHVAVRPSVLDTVKC